MPTRSRHNPLLRLLLLASAVLVVQCNFHQAHAQTSEVEVAIRCNQAFSFYQIYHSSRTEMPASIWVMLRSETENALHDLQTRGVVTSAEDIEALRQLALFGPKLDHSLIWEAIAKTFSKNGFKDQKSIRLFVEMARTAEVLPESFEDFLEEAVKQLPANLPDTSVKNLIQVAQIRKLHYLRPDHYEWVRVLLASPTPERTALLKNLIAFLILAQDADVSKRIMPTRNFINRWLRDRAVKKAGIEFTTQGEVLQVAESAKLVEENARADEERIRNELEFFKQNSGRDFQDLYHRLTLSDSKETVLLAVEAWIESIDFVSDNEYYLILEKLPLGLESGRPNTHTELDVVINKQRKLNNETEWGRYFAPTDRRILYLVLSKVKSIGDPERFRASLSDLVAKVEQTYQFQANNSVWRQEVRKEMLRKHYEVSVSAFQSD